MGSLPSQFFISCPLKYHKVKAICGVNTAGTQRGGKLKLICNFNERRLRPKLFPKWKKKEKKKKHPQAEQAQLTAISQKFILM